MRVPVEPPRSADLRDEQGAIAILVAILSVVLIVMAAFATDVGLALASRRALSTGADSASLAIVRAEYQKVVKAPALTCAQLVATDQASSKAIAVTQLNANAPFGTTITASQVNDNPLSCVGANSGVLQATVTVNATTKSVFGGLVGVSSFALSRTSASALGAVNVVTGALPLTVCTNQALPIVVNGVADLNNGVVRHELITINKVWTGPGITDCDSAQVTGGSGNWGWLYCDGGGASGLAQNITSGCPNPITLDTSTTPPSYSFTGEPGNKGNSKLILDAMQGLMDTDVTIPVYDAVTGHGANTTYRVIGFLTVKLCGYSSNNKQALGACYLSGTDPVSGQDVSLVSDSLQVEYVAYTPAATFSGFCALGNPCSFNTYIYKLVQ